MQKRILLVGGGSGGHAFPLIAVAQALRSQATKTGVELELLMAGDDSRGFLARAAQEAHISYKHLLAGKLPRYLTPSFLLDLIKIPFGFLQAFWTVFWYMPDVIFSKGGYDSVASVFAGWVYRIPIYLHESDTIPGLANRWVARFARQVFISFASSEQYFPGKSILTGNPVRPELFTADRAQSLSSLNFSPDRKTILILGGSQGAKEINDVIMNALVELVREYQVIHQCGDSQYQSVRSTVDGYIREGRNLYGTVIEERYRLYPFLNAHELAMAYAAADVVITRAGAGLLFEVATLGKPAIVIPLASSANGHQLANAIEFGKTGVSILEGANMTTHILMSQIKAILEPMRATDIKSNLATFAKPGAADAIAGIVLANL